MKARKNRITKKRLLLIALGLLALIIFESFLLMLRYERLNRSNELVLGVSFSPAQAERYGSDWRANYIALLDDLNFKHIRIPAYWDMIEPTAGNYDFTETDWMVSEAAKRNAKITLVVGQKNIRYPECFYPKWIDLNDTANVSQKVTDMVSAVIRHYKNNPAIYQWQLENEFLLKSFGNCPSKLLTSKQLQKEMSALKAEDNSRKVILTQSDQFGFPLKGPFGNIFGFSMYRWAWDKRIGYFRYPQTGEYFWWKAAIIGPIFNQSIKVHELQAEAWGPVGNEHLSYDESVKTMNPKQFLDNISYAKQTRIKSVDLWGAEWWWHMKQKGHNEMWESVKATIPTSQAIK